MAELKFLYANCVGEPTHKFRHLAAEANPDKTLCDKPVVLANRSESSEAFVYSQEILDGSHNHKFYCDACHKQAASLAGLTRQSAPKVAKD